VALVGERARNGASSVARYHLRIFLSSGGVALARLRTAPRITEHFGHGVLILRRHHIIVKIELIVASRFNHWVNPQPWPQVKDIIIWIVALFIPKKYNEHNELRLY